MSTPSIPKPVLSAALTLLQPYYPDLSASALVAFIEVGGKEPEAGDDLRLLSVADMKDLSGLCRLTFHRLIKSGALPAVHIGRRVLVRRDAFDKWCQAGGTGRKGGPAA